MKVISTNIGKPTTVPWRGREIQTGIFKYPVKKSIFLQKEDVKHDAVIDRKHHGGEFKACYLFGADYYGYWKEKYPKLDWNWGMFGENLTVEGLDENQLCVGDIFKVGTANVQVTEPRQPCYKLGIRFGTQKILKEFIDFGHSGTYVRILEEGHVKEGDKLKLHEKSVSPLTVQQYNELVNSRKKDASILRLALENDSIRKEKREQLKKLLH
ncbi:MOSC domain-containing protein [Allomuricauda sp. d1]|uniref:MOSC domain-containing protein n=1 Tax=Allomuricauda sp. d1 TaxID=3136725 RepID=UPI0031D72C8A